MKRIILLWLTAVFVFASCVKSYDNSHIDPEFKESKMECSSIEICDVVDILMNIEIDNSLCQEVFVSVNESINKGLDENLLLRELWMEEADVKVKSYNPESILKQRIEEYLHDRLQTKSDTYQFMDSNIQIYWPYSENWDGETRPVIAPATSMPQDTLIGYRISRDKINGNHHIVDTLLVDDEFAYKNPVWIINYSEYSYDDIVIRKPDSAVTTKAGGHYKWLITKMQVNKQYDKLSNGASEFDILCRYPVSPYMVDADNKTRLLFTRSEIRNEKFKILSEEEGLLNDDWKEEQLSNLFVLIEYDGGGSASYVTGSGIQYKDPVSGTIYSLSTSFTIEESDTIMLQRNYGRSYYFQLDHEKEHSLDSGNIVWYSPIIEY